MSGEFLLQEVGLWRKPCFGGGKARGGSKVREGSLVSTKARYVEKALLRRRQGPRREQGLWRKPCLGGGKDLGVSLAPAEARSVEEALLHRR